QALGVVGRAQLPPREAPAQLGLDQGHDVDAVDEQAAVALQQPGRVDLHPGNIAATDHDISEVAAHEPCSPQTPVVEGPTPQDLRLAGAHGGNLPQRT